MIKIIVKEEMYIYDMYHILRAFYPGSEIDQTIDSGVPNLIELRIDEQQKECLLINQNEVEEYAERKQKKRYVNLKVYDWLSEQTGKELAWGVLTGIRPTKIMMNLLEEGKSEQDVINYMKENYRTTDKKANLGMEIAKREKALLAQLDYKDGYSLYVGIPFCPTTCSYCSFTSQPIHKWKNRVDEYLDALCKEITFVGEVSKEKKLNTVYIGGGTPTTLEPEQLERLLSHIEKTFSFEDLKEFTVEAGRPDSITKEKLEVLRRHQISRISINPQTMQQKTLDCIGRKHTVEDIRQVYAMARELGFENINMDLIAGLPGETLDDMKDTLRQIEMFAPDSLTVHALAMKRASRLTQEKREGSYQGNAFICNDQRIEMPDMFHEAMKPYDGKEVVMGIRPEDLHGEGIVADTYPTSHFMFDVEVSELLGHEFILHGRFGKQRLEAKVAARIEARPHEDIELAMDLSKVHFFDKETEETII